MKCSSCGKALELEESRHTGLCYGCRKPSWDRSTTQKPTGLDPFVLVDQLRTTLAAEGFLTQEIDASLQKIIADLSKKKK